MLSGQLEQSNSSLQAFWDMCVKSNSFDAEDQPLRSMLEGVLCIIDAEFGCLVVVDEEDKIVIVESFSKECTTCQASTTLTCDDIIKRALLQNKTLTKNGGECLFCERINECREECKKCFFICAPIEKTNGEHYLFYFTNIETKKSFSEFDVETVAFICKRIAPEFIKKYYENGRHGDNDATLEQQLRQDYDFNSIIGHDARIIRLLDLIVKVKDLDVPVLIEGESGTGKEMITRAIHYNSKRKKEPLVCINCGAIPENLLESELFGHEKGAFTGASSTKTGQIKTAGAGTILLDEIDDLNFNLQVKLLRVLQWGEFTPVGSSKPEKTIARFIAASKHDLKKLVEKGGFRDDLYYRLNVLRLHLPPLRERLVDIPSLCTYFLEKHAKKLGKQTFSISQAALNALMNYDFPGNIRELENILQRAIILSENTFINSEHLPFEIRKYSESQNNRNDALVGKFKDAKDKMVEDFEREFLRRKLAESQGIILRAARNAGMYEANFRQKMIRYGLLPENGSSKNT
jgi:transcriptional regulator with GAF, ATPase, and Fis domain